MADPAAAPPGVKSMLANTKLEAAIWEEICRVHGNSFTSMSRPAVRLITGAGLVEGCDDEIVLEYQPASAVSRPNSQNSPPLSAPSSPLLSGSPSLRASQSLRILDNACGLAGSITVALAVLSSRGVIRNGKDIQIYASDATADRVQNVAKTLKAAKLDNVTFVPWPMEALAARSGYFSHVFTNFSAHWSQDDALMLREILRVLKPGGIACFASWQSTGWHSTATNGDIIKITPSGGWMEQDYIKRVLAARGFQDVTVTSETFDSDFDEERFQKLVPNLVDTALGKLWNKENTDADDEESRAMMRESLMETYMDGHFTGKMSVWLTHARKPRQ